MQRVLQKYSTLAIRNYDTLQNRNILSEQHTINVNFIGDELSQSENARFFSPSNRNNKVVLINIAIIYIRFKWNQEAFKSYSGFSFGIIFSHYYWGRYFGFKKILKMLFKKWF